MANELDNITDNINDFGSEYDSIIGVNNSTFTQSRDLEAINNSTVFSIKRSILNYPAQAYFTFISKGYRFIQGIMRYGFFSEYKSTRIYSLNAKVCVSSSYYRSLIDNNLGANLSASNYNSATTYALNANAKDSSTGDIYKSLIANNLNNALTDNTKWQLIWKRLSPVIESNSYNDLFNKPTNLSQFIDDTGSLKSISTYSVISAKTNTSGYASFINTISNTEISFDVSVPIVLCYADGFIESNATLTNITGISADGTYFIIKEKGSNPYVTTLQPVESIVAPSTPATNQLWLDISIMPYVPKKWNGSQWVSTQFVKLGECVKNTGSLGSSISYALNRRYKSDEFTVVINTIYTKQDNLGTLDANVELYARCISSEGGYAVNSIVKPIPHINATANRAIPSTKYDANTSKFCSYNYGDSGMIIPSLTTKADAGMTSARWRFFFVVQANF